jgi:hypothetical protein
MQQWPRGALPDPLHSDLHIEVIAPLLVSGHFGLPGDCSYWFPLVPAFSENQSSDLFSQPRVPSPRASLGFLSRFLFVDAHMAVRESPANSMLAAHHWYSTANNPSERAYHSSQSFILSPRQSISARIPGREWRHLRAQHGTSMDKRVPPGENQHRQNYVDNFPIYLGSRELLLIPS